MRVVDFIKGCGTRTKGLGEVDIEVPRPEITKDKLKSMTRHLSFGNIAT